VDGVVEVRSGGQPRPAPSRHRPWIGPRSGWSSLPHA